MRGMVDPAEDGKSEPLEDRTEALIVRSRRTERVQRKQRIKANRSTFEPRDLLSLPYELIMEILTYLRPSDMFSLLGTSKPLAAFIRQEESVIARTITNWRYVCLEKCFRLPVLLEHVDPSVHPALLSDERHHLRSIHKQSYQHIQPPDPLLICTCQTCSLRWSALCLVVDFAHWQANLDAGEPIPMIARGGRSQWPAWNMALVVANADAVAKALRSPLWYARLLEAHLDSTTRAIRRHAENKGNRRRRFRMTKEDVESGTDLFLEGTGPPTLDFPFHRDNYYMLEAYLPNRGWYAKGKIWLYMPAQQHDRDVEFVVRWVESRKGRILTLANERLELKDGVTVAVEKKVTLQKSR